MLSNKALVAAIPVVALAFPGAAAAQSSPAGSPPPIAVGTAPSATYTGKGWSVSVPPDWTKDVFGPESVGGSTAACPLVMLNTEHAEAKGATLESVVATEMATPPVPGAKVNRTPATIHGQPGAQLDVALTAAPDMKDFFGGGFGGGREYVWLENNQTWKVSLVQVCKDGATPEFASWNDTFTNQIWPTFKLNAPSGSASPRPTPSSRGAASPPASAAAAGASNNTIDANSLVDYTGSGWDISVPPGWGPQLQLGPGWVGGTLPDGTTKAAIYVASGNPNSQGLDVISAAFVKGLGNANVTSQTNTTMDDQSAVQLDLNLGNSLGRAYVWIDSGTYWIVAYVAGTTDPNKAGLDLFKNQLLPTFDDSDSYDDD